MYWVLWYHAFIESGDNYYSVFEVMDGGPWTRANYIVDGITGGISTVLVDTTIVCHI